MEILPKGVQLYDPTDVDTRRALIFDSVKSAVTSAYPKAFGGVRLELADDVDYDGPADFSPTEQKQAILQGSFLTRKLRGTVRLFDDATGDLLDEKKTTLMQVPWMSPRGTFIHGGNEYTSIAQARLVPGTYGRWTDSGQAEVHFNAKPGTGSSFRVMLEPETAQMRLMVGPQSSVHLYSVLKDLGVQDDELRTTWGEGTFEMNSSKYNPRAFDQAYSRLVPAKLQTPDAPREEKVKQVVEALERTQVLRSVANTNMPHWGDARKSAALNTAAQEFTKEAALALQELRQLALLLNEKADARINVMTTVTELESQIMAFLSTANPEDIAFLPQLEQEVPSWG